MSTQVGFERRRLSPGVIAVIGLILMLAAFAVDIATDPTPAHAAAANANVDGAVTLDEFRLASERTPS